MATDLDKLRRTWSVLGSVSVEDLLRTAPLQSTSGCEVRVGVDRLGARHMLVPVARRDERTPENVEGALSLQRRRLQFSHGTHEYLDIECVRPDLYDLFDQVLEDVLETLLSSTPSDSAIEVVERWRNLLATRSKPHLSASAQVGLFAELYVLGLIHRTGLIASESWRGPLGEPHDISLSHCDLEVKGIGRRSERIEIHGTEQLEANGKPLALVVVRIDESTNGETLSELVDRTIQRVDDRFLVLRKLSRLGYEATDRAQYSTRYRVAAVRFLAVGAKTPRIVQESFHSGSVPSGVTGVNYTLALGALEPILQSGTSLLLDWVDEGWKTPAGESDV